MTKRLAVALLALVAAAAPMRADFAEVARAIDAQSGVRRIWIPFLGLARAAVWVASPKGVHDFQLVTFEGGGRIDPQQLHAILRSNIGADYKPLVQVWSKRSRDWSFIYARPSRDGNRVDLMILTHDNDDTVLVRVDVETDAIAREIAFHPRNVRDVAGR